MLSRYVQVRDFSARSVEPIRRDGAGWLQWPMVRSDASLRLFCFFYAGVGASGYRQWGFSLFTSVEVAAIQLPGRPNRLAESPLADIPSLIDALASNLAPHLKRRFAFFGHSMGELAHALRDCGLASPSHLIVCGRKAPVVRNRFPLLGHLPDNLFVAEINKRYGGIAPEILQHRRYWISCSRACVQISPRWKTSPFRRARLSTSRSRFSAATVIDGPRWRISWPGERRTLRPARSCVSRRTSLFGFSPGQGARGDSEHIASDRTVVGIASS